MLALRLNRHLNGAGLVYRGPAEWSERAQAEPVRPPGDLIAGAEGRTDGELADHANVRRLLTEQLLPSDVAKPV